MHDTVDAFSARELGLVPLEDGDAEVDESHLVLECICVQEFGRLLCEERQLFEVLVRGDDLLPREILQSKVGGQVLDVWIIGVCSNEFECTVLVKLLDLHRQVILARLWILSGVFTVDRCELLDDGDEEPRRVLVLRHDPQAFGQLVQDLLLVVPSKHGRPNDITLGAALDCLQWHVLELFELIEVALHFLAIFLCLFDFFDLGTRLHIQELPCLKPGSELELRQRDVQNTDLTLVGLQERSDDRLILNWVQRACRVAQFTTDLQQL